MATIRKRTGDIIETDVDDETIVVQLETGDMYSLAGTARSIWRLLDGTTDEPALVAQLAAGLSADRATIAADVGEFCREMRAAGLVATD